MSDSETSTKNWNTTFLLCILFVGIFGAHQFYLGRWKMGVLYLVFPFIGFFLCLLDIYYLWTGKMKDAEGKKMHSYKSWRDDVWAKKLDEDWAKLLARASELKKAKAEEAPAEEYSELHRSNLQERNRKSGMKTEGLAFFDTDDFEIVVYPRRNGGKTIEIFDSQARLNRISAYYNWCLEDPRNRMGHMNEWLLGFDYYKKKPVDVLKWELGNIKKAKKVKILCPKCEDSTRFKMNGLITKESHRLYTMNVKKDGRRAKIKTGQVRRDLHANIYRDGIDINCLGCSERLKISEYCWVSAGGKLDNIKELHQAEKDFIRHINNVTISIKKDDMQTLQGEFIKFESEFMSAPEALGFRHHGLTEMEDKSLNDGFNPHEGKYSFRYKIND